MKKHNGKILFWAVFFFFISFFPVNTVKADSYFTAWFDILNDPSFGYHQAQYAPSTLNLIFLSYSYTDHSDTHVKIDCNNDGTYEIDRTIVVPPSPYGGYWMYRNGGGYFISGGDYWRYNDPNSGEPAYWASIRDNSLNCFYPKPGNYTIKMIAERGGIKQEGARSFSLREPMVNMDAKGFYDNDIIGTLYLPGPSVWMGKPIKAPADIDFGVAVYNSKPEWSLFTPTGTLKFDCEGDGKYDATRGYSKETNVSGYGQEWQLWCAPYSNTATYWSSCKNSISNSMNWYPKVCHYDKPGIYQAIVRAELPTGAEPYTRDTWVSVPVLPSNPNAVIDFSTGSDPTFGEAPLKGVDLKVNVNGVTWAHTTYSFDCGNGQTTNYSINSTYPKDFSQDYSYTLKDFCNYTTAGEYIAKANLEFRALKFPGGVDNALLPSTLFTKVSETSNYTTYVAKKEFKIVATGLISGGTPGNMARYIITSPFNLRWDVDSASSCVVSQMDGIYSKTINKSIGTIEGIDVSAGLHDYKLNCVSKAGGSIEKIIKLNVVKP